MSERIEYWVQRQWPFDKAFKDVISCKTPEDAVAYRDLEARRYEMAKHIAVKRTITEEVL